MKYNPDSFLSTLFSRLFENRKFFNALLLGTISSVANQGLNFITILFITRQLGESDMGGFSLVQSMVIFFATFGILGQNISSTALTSRFKKRYPNQLGLLIGNAYLLSALMVVAAGLIIFSFSNFFFREIPIDSPSELLTRMVIILWFAGMTFDMLQVSTLIGLEAYRDLVKTDILKGLFSIIVILPLALKFGLFGAITGYFISSIIGIALNQWFIRRILGKMACSVNYRISLRIFRPILRIGLPVFTAALFISLSTWLTNRLIFNSLNGPEALGIVFICRQILVLLQFIPAQISKVLLPIIAEDRNTIEEARIKRVGLGLSVAVCSILALTGLLFEKSVLNVYNLDPEVALYPYRIILATVLFAALNMILGQFVIAGKNPWIRAYADMIISVVMVLVTLSLIEVNIFISLPVAIIISFIASDIFLVRYLGRSIFKSEAKET